MWCRQEFPNFEFNLWQNRVKDAQVDSLLKTEWRKMQRWFASVWLCWAIKVEIKLCHYLPHFGSHEFRTVGGWWRRLENQVQEIHLKKSIAVRSWRVTVSPRQFYADEFMLIPIKRIASSGIVADLLHGKDLTKIRFAKWIIYVWSLSLWPHGHRVCAKWLHLST